MPITDVNEYAARMQKVGRVDVEAAMAPMNRRSSYPMTTFERKQVEEGAENPIYIYNVSPVHEWPINQGQLGVIRIGKRVAGKQVSEPIAIPGVVARQFDKGLGKKGWFLEDGMDIAEDICQCSEKYPPGHAASNLTNWGVFLSRKKFEDLSEKEQKRLVHEATQKLIAMCQTYIQQADQYHEGNPAPMYKGLIGPGHRNCLTAYNEATGSNLQKPWATTAVSVTQKSECQFCGSQNKVGTCVCATCGRVTNKEQYEKLEGKKAS